MVIKPFIILKKLQSALAKKRNFKLATNVLQISEGTNSLELCEDLGFCLCAVMRSPYFFVLIFNELETILKINEKYFEKSLQLSK
jgi:hypothetical protein